MSQNCWFPRKLLNKLQGDLSATVVELGQVQQVTGLLQLGCRQPWPCRTRGPRSASSLPELLPPCPCLVDDVRTHCGLRAPLRRMDRDRSERDTYCRSNRPCWARIAEMRHLRHPSKKHKLPWSPCPAKGQGVVDHRDGFGNPKLLTRQVRSEKPGVFKLHWHPFERVGDVLLGEEDAGKWKALFPPQN